MSLISKLRNCNAGFSLIEVLVALFVLALGVLGAAALQMNSLKYNQTASIRTQATFLAYDIVDRMRANRKAAQNGDYQYALSATVKPTGNTVAQTDLNAWLTAIEQQLPEGDGGITQTGQVFRITVQWNEARTGGSTTQQFVFETQL